MEISYGLVNLMYFMLCSEHWRIKGSRSNKRRQLLTCFTNSLFKVYNNLSLRETGPEVYNNIYISFQVHYNTTFTNKFSSIGRSTPFGVWIYFPNSIHCISFTLRYLRQKNHRLYIRTHSWYIVIDIELLTSWHITSTQQLNLNITWW